MARHDGLDAARALAMMFVVATHAAISFMVTPIGWAIQDRSQHLGVDLYVWIVRAFAMPTFFWLSGYFFRAVNEHGGAKFARHRLTRILVPLALAIVPCSLAIDALWDWGHRVGHQGAVAVNAPKFQGSELPLILGHLWYLYYLLWFSVAAAAIAWLARRLRVPALGSVATLAIPALLIVGVLAVLGALQPDTPLGFAPDLPIAVYNGAFFAWGWLVHARPDELERYAHHARHAIGVALVLLAIVVATLFATVDVATPDLPPLYAIAASGLFSVAVVLAFVGLCVRHARPHPVLRLASEASYWVYVAHLPLVVLLQILVANLAVPGVIKYAAIVAVTTLACMVTYELLVRRTRMRRVLG